MLPQVWALLAGLGVILVATGALPVADARAVAITRGGPILGFLVAITVLAELADRAGVFDAAAGGCAKLARGSTLRLFLLVAALGSITTIGMSLDTTAVLLTPVVLSLAQRLGLPPWPFALLAVWLANAASLLLPVSNLTNLLAVGQLHLSTASFAGRMALPELVAVVITVGYLGALFRQDLRGRYVMPATSRPKDRVLFWISTAACVALVPAVVIGVAPWIAATPCALVTATAFGVRRRGELSFGLLPWRLVIAIEGLFLCVATVSRHGGTRVLAELSGHSALATTAVAGVTSNAVNNLPAYLAVSASVPPGHPTQLLAALLGTNAGPLVLVWGSLATLLWRDRCRARGVPVSMRRFALVGLGGVPLLLIGTWAVLLVTA